MPEPLRVDVVLHRLCLMRSRSEAKAACDVQAVRVDGIAVRASHPVRTGQVVEVRFPNRSLAVELLELPGKSISKRAARDLYRVVGEESAVKR